MLDITQLGGAHFRVVNVELGVSYHFVALVGAGLDGLDMWSTHFTVFRVSTVNCSTNLVSTTPHRKSTPSNIPRSVSHILKPASCMLLEWTQYLQTPHKAFDPTRMYSASPALSLLTRSVDISLDTFRISP